MHIQAKTHSYNCLISRNWEDVKSCIFANIEGCNDADYFATMSWVQYTVLRLGLPSDCLNEIDWMRTEGNKDLPFIMATNTLMEDIAAVILTKESTICDAFKSYKETMDSAILSPFLSHLGQEWFGQWNAVIMDYCGPGELLKML